MNAAKKLARAAKVAARQENKGMAAASKQHTQLARHGVLCTLHQHFVDEEIDMDHIASWGLHQFNL